MTNDLLPALSYCVPIRNHGIPASISPSASAKPIAERWNFTRSDGALFAQILAPCATQSAMNISNGCSATMNRVCGYVLALPLTDHRVLGGMRSTMRDV